MKVFGVRSARSKSEPVFVQIRGARVQIRGPGGAEGEEKSKVGSVDPVHISDSWAVAAFGWGQMGPNGAGWVYFSALDVTLGCGHG